MNKEAIKNAVFINGEKCQTKEKLFDYFSEKFNFPNYFGHNWDSFEEILYDLEINNSVIIYNFEAFLPNDAENLEIFKDILNQYNTDTKSTFYTLSKI